MYSSWVFPALKVWLHLKEWWSQKPTTWIFNNKPQPNKQIQLYYRKKTPTLTALRIISPLKVQCYIHFFFILRLALPLTSGQEPTESLSWPTRPASRQRSTWTLLTCFSQLPRCALSHVFVVFLTKDRFKYSDVIEANFHALSWTLVKLNLHPVGALTGRYLFRFPILAQVNPSQCHISFLAIRLVNSSNLFSARKAGFGRRRSIDGN